MSSNNTPGAGSTTFEVTLNRSVSSELNCSGGIFEQMQQANIFSYGGFNLENHLEELYKVFNLKPITKEEKLNKFKQKVKQYVV